jgi:hypothetical protein
VRFEEGRAIDNGFRIKIPAYSTFKVTALGQISEAVFLLLLDGTKYFVRKSLVKTSLSWNGLGLHERKDLALIIE